MPKPDVIVTFQNEIPAEPVTTSGVIAMHNLQAQVEAFQSRTTLAVADRATLIDLIALRGQICGRIADGEEAADLAEELVHDAPEAGQTYIVRARTRSIFHLFSAALGDLDLAERHGVDANTVNRERAGIFEAVGRYDEALELCREAASRMPTFQSLGVLAAIHAARGECDVAERLFQDSRDRYRGVSPFPPAMLDFRRGHMWLAEDNLVHARSCFVEAQARLPAYAAAQGHLAEVDAAQGDVEAAITRLLPLANSSDDPDYAAQLSRILEDAGRAEDARPWRACAATRYDELVAAHLEAFADHAAEFWLMGNADLKRALQFAKVNFEVRKTKRARDLLARALTASGQPY
jgi:tetratricopeptide (TPR) repeat protein